MYIHYSTGSNSGPRTLVWIVEVSVLGGVHFQPSLRAPVSENSIGVPPLRILCGYSHYIVLFGKIKASQERLASRIKRSVGYSVER